MKGAGLLWLWLHRRATQKIESSAAGWYRILLATWRRFRRNVVWSLSIYPR
jgi:hypothetical protein